MGCVKKINDSLPVGRLIVKKINTLFSSWRLREHDIILAYSACAPVMHGIAGFIGEGVVFGMILASNTNHRLFAKKGLGGQEIEGEPMHLTRIKSKAGLTLVELMVTLGIIAILGAVAFSMAASTVPRYNLRAEARELVINFKKARMEAMKRNRDVVLAFTPGVGTEGGSYQIFADADGDHTYVAGVDTYLSIQPMRPHVLLTNVTFSASKTWYNPRGMVTLNKTGRCEIRMNDGSNRYRLVLSTTGAVRVEASKDGGTTWTVQ